MREKITATMETSQKGDIFCVCFLGNFFQSVLSLYVLNWDNDCLIL